MRIAIMYNPISGAGRAKTAAESMAQALSQQGCEACTICSMLAPSVEWLDKELQGADVLVVAGGDGAMRMAAPAACRSGTPVYHLPLGTENLFAREFGMDGSPQTLLRAIERKRIRRVDVGVANGRWFLLMASVGFDAEVVHHLASTRGASISHLTYLKPIFASMRSWSPPTLDIEVDGASVVSGERGMVVIANSRQYGWRIDPAGRADMSDGLLDVVFFPARSLLQVVRWVARSRMRRQFKHPALRFARGRQITVRAQRHEHFQLDGDPPGVVHEMLPEGLAHSAVEDAEGGNDRPLLLRIGICPAALPVLTVRD